MRRRASLGLGALLAAAALLGLLAASAGATSYQRPFEEVFGPVEQPTFEWPRLIVADPTSGDVVVGDLGEAADNLRVKRYHADGTQAPFTALGSNAIDGKAGPGGKPCAEEPASCDKTPQNGIQGSDSQLVVDPTDGDIYLAQPGNKLIDIFSAEGRYLGQLTAAGLKGFGFVRGVAVDAGGAVYVSSVFGTEFLNGIAKFVPSANPPVNADNTAIFPVSTSEYTSFFASGTGTLAAGMATTAGSLFARVGRNAGGNAILEMDEETGEYHELARGGFENRITVDPTSGNPIAVTSANAGFPEAAELDPSGGVASRLVLEGHGFGIDDLAVDSAGDVYVVAGPQDPHVFLYGHPGVVATVTVNPAANVTGSQATLTGTVDPEGVEVGECFFEWGPTNSGGFTKWQHTAPCEGVTTLPADSSEHTGHATITGMTPNGTKYSFRLAAKNENGTERSTVESLNTAYAVRTEAADPIGLSSATLNGTLRPEGVEFSQCYFEWGLTSSASYEAKSPCNPPGAAIEADFSSHAVSAPLTGLQKGTTYRFRLIAINSEGAHEGEELKFTTHGPPQITEVRARDATQSTATIEAKIDPSGFGTSYRFEWGTGEGYGHLIPAEYEPFIGEGTTPVRLNANVGGLSPASVYHYRVVASSSVGTTTSPDETLETLNSCGLPEGRCYELVSPREVGPVATPGAFPSNAEMHFQAATAGPGALAYAAEAGFPDATKGAEVLYRGSRNAAAHAWESTQLSTPIVGPDEQKGASSGSGKTLALSDDLSCGVAESFQPLTEDPAMRLAIEAGGSNLYRINPDNSYTPISYLAPENPEHTLVNNYRPAGIAKDCGKVVFSSEYRYPGIAGEGNKRLYEWEEGTLRNAGVIPGSEGETLAAASAPGGTNAVSEDGSKVFFTAARKTSPNPAEIGKTALFVREDGSTTRDISLSETATAGGNATFRWATPDGSKVFFTANAGLTAQASSEGTDLYEYDFAKPEGERLTDLSVDHEAGGAAVAGFLGASEDGSHVYFTARGQLVPGAGNTFAQNQSAGTWSVYGESGGRVDYAGVAGAANVFSAYAQVSPDGRYLIFESSANVTGYESGGAVEVYLYDSQAPSEATVCASCRQDGQPPTATDYMPLRDRSSTPLHPPRFIIERDGKPVVFFRAMDALAPGAVEGQSNLYEWSHGQVFRVTSEPAGLSLGGAYVNFAGASQDGSDLYFSTVESLNWEDGDERSSVYDARIGGGFPEPSSPPAPCEPDAEGSCQGQGSAGPSVPGAASAAFSGPGNPSAQSAKAKKKHKKKAHKRKHKRHSKRARPANANRRAGK